ncbi:MAG: nucleotidyltransferase domain-containing protein [Candidatus Hydrogenedentes bacterium]|nr:nucleotidyltransferase domain-containing protein [Candidatus Hydrogenedentota bacterium]
MLSAEIRRVITDTAREFNVRAVWLFGSSLQEESESRDIDLAVEGLDPKDFFRFYGELFFTLPKPVDLVDLSQNPSIAPIIRETGVRIYER